MRVLLLIHNEAAPRAAAPPFPEADHALAEGACPLCGTAPFKVAGTGKHIARDDRAYEADAVALCCNRHVGTLRAEPETFFGIREDEAIAHLGVRIY